MSKRSYRRLAVVAGAALAIGSMAPAMAARVGGDADGNASISVDSIDVSDVMASIQSSNLPLPTDLVFQSVGNVKSTVDYYAPLLVGDGRNVTLGGIHCVRQAALGLDTDLSALATLGVSLSDDQIAGHADVEAPVESPLSLVDDLKDCIGEIKSNARTALHDAKEAAGAVTDIAAFTALSAAASAQTLPGAMLNTATPLVFNYLNGITVNAVAQTAAMVSLF